MAGGQRGDHGGAAARITRRRAVALGLGAAGGVVAGVVGGVAAGLVSGAASGSGAGQALLIPVALDRPADGVLRPAVRRGRPVPSRGWTTESIGTSVRGREIAMWHSPGLTAAAKRVIVVSGLHGNERGTWPLAERISQRPLPDDVSVWIVPSANPDGWEAGSRRNAHGVDLNRNFPWRWSPGDGGSGPASAPETKAVMAAVAAIRPHLSIWIHQPLAYVAPIGSTPVGLARAWANEVGDRVRTDIDQHGGGETWANKVLGVPSLLVELGGWTLTDTQADAHARAFTRCLDVLRAS